MLADTPVIPVTVAGESSPTDAVASKPVKLTSSFGTITVPKEEVAPNPDGFTTTHDATNGSPIEEVAA